MLMKCGWWVITPWRKRYLGRRLPESVKRHCEEMSAFGYEMYRSKYACFMFECDVEESYP
jgi:hypothetical protein